jgi:hypothetical protein
MTQQECVWAVRDEQGDFGFGGDRSRRGCGWSSDCEREHKRERERGIKENNFHIEL